MSALAVEVSEAAKWDAYLARASQEPMRQVDRRVMNSMEPDTKLVHIRLETWARWSRLNPEMREYPQVSLMGKVAEYGLEAMAAFMSSSHAPISMPEAVEVTDRAVSKLGEIDRKVLKAYYLHWQSIEVLARRVGMRAREFQNVLRRARFRVRCYIEAIESEGRL